MKIEMGNIEEVVNLIEKRWGMFLLKRKLDYLYQFLFGLSFNEEQEINTYFWNNFHDFSVNYISQKRANYSKSSDNWCYEIRNVCKNEEEELELFFAIFREFMDYFHKIDKVYEI